MDCDSDRTPAGIVVGVVSGLPSTLMECINQPVLAGSAAILVRELGMDSGKLPTPKPSMGTSQCAKATCRGHRAALVAIEYEHPHERTHPAAPGYAMEVGRLHKTTCFVKSRACVMANNNALLIADHAGIHQREWPPKVQSTVAKPVTLATLKNKRISN